MTVEVRTSTFEESFDRALPLISKHWDECSFGDWKDIGVEVDSDKYETCEEEGYLKTIVAEDDGELIGYLVVLSCEMTHHKGLWHATTDVIYVDPAYRDKGVATMMIDKAKELCKAHGISFFSVVVNSNFDFSKMMEKMGAIMTERTYSWRL